MWMRDLISQDVDGSDRPDYIDLAELEIYRDRERSVPRYNEFRRRMLQILISKWEDLTDNEEAIKTFREIYGDDVEKLDLLVGMAGFAISEAAFFIFLLMASRRLEADRFFTSNYNEAYTKKELKWVNTTENLKDVLDCHYPKMTTKWMNSSSALSVWDSSPEPHNPIPLYFRILIEASTTCWNLTFMCMHVSKSRFGGGVAGGFRRRSSVAAAAPRWWCWSSPENGTLAMVADAPSLVVLELVFV
ncbi:hypothetical protein K7X08_029022 [Anisodus acutangulus]|uniref:Uncharacterized protein n=1 Tax=Anisodus acutangulus TaxID=402998 RepID=A0A9Q1L387_9SOLA|nr:hypothetical protein K7X08_029022 [Anisodus acutangulus]